MSEPLLPREVRRRLAIIQHAEEVTGNVAMTCRYYGISRTVYYRWLRRYREQGLDGLREVLATAPQPQRHPCRRRRQDPLSAPELPFRARQDRDVPQAIPRRRGIPVRGMADPQAAWTSTACRPYSATNGSTNDGNATKSSSPATRSKSTSNSSSHFPPRPGPVGDGVGGCADVLGVGARRAVWRRSPRSGGGAASGCARPTGSVTQDRVG
jgi:transposase-like protein